MESDLETGKQLVDELLDLWSECQNRCNRIEKIIEELNEKNTSKKSIFSLKI